VRRLNAAGGLRGIDLSKPIWLAQTATPAGGGYTMVPTISVAAAW
jgi:hypothetical protein